MATVGKLLRTRSLFFGRQLSRTFADGSNIKVTSVPPGAIEEKHTEHDSIITDRIEDHSSITGVPEEHIRTRRARIFKPTKNAMQSGTFGNNKWRIEFDNRMRWENPLMGWCSTGDPLSNSHVEFTEKEQAIDFCAKNGWECYVEEPKQKTPKPRTYADNFSWNKKTRTSTK